MTITAQQIINKAFLITGIKAINETPTGAESTDALLTLNMILETYQLEQLLQYDDIITTGTLTPGLNPHTIGPTGTFVAARPNSIISAYIRDLSNIDYPLTIIDSLQYDDIYIKSLQTQIPAYLFYNPKFPNGEIFLSTVPSAAYSIKIRYKNPLSSYASLSTSNSYPNGYSHLLCYQLATQLASEYGQPRQDLQAIADNIKNTIKKNNWQSYELNFDPRMPFGDNSDSGFNFHTGLSGW